MVLEVIQRPTNTMSPPEETLLYKFIYVHLVLTLAGGGEEAGQHGAGGDRAADAGDDGGDGRRHLRQAGRRRDCRPRLPRLWRRRHHRCAVGWAAACKTTTPMPNTFLPPWFTHRRRLAPGLAWLPASPDVTRLLASARPQGDDSVDHVLTAVYDGPGRQDGADAGGPVGRGAAVHQEGLLHGAAPVRVRHGGPGPAHHQQRGPALRQDAGAASPAAPPHCGSLAASGFMAAPGD